MNHGGRTEALGFDSVMKSLLLENKVIAQAVLSLTMDFDIVALAVVTEKERDGDGTTSRSCPGKPPIWSTAAGESEREAPRGCVRVRGLDLPGVRPDVAATVKTQSDFWMARSRSSELQRPACIRLMLALM